MYLNLKHVYFCLVILLFVSCKSKKLAQDIRIEQNTSESALQILEGHNIEYEWFSAKAKLKYSDPSDSESGTTYIRIKRDSTIWITLKKYSVEGFRLSFNPDSIVILNRLEKTYSIAYWEDLSRKYDTDLNYAKLQNWLVGNVELPQDSSKLHTYADTSAFTFEFLKEEIHHSYTVPLFHNTISDYTIEDRNGKKVNLRFDDCKKEYDFCYFREYSIPLSGDEEIFLRLEISELEINVPKKTAFEIPTRYTRI